MLDEQEQKIWDEIERNYQEEPRGAVGGRAGTWSPAPSGRGDLPVPIVGGVWASVFLVIFGLAPAAAAVGAATGLIWLLWRFLPHLGGDAVGSDEDVEDRTFVAHQGPVLRWHRPVRRVPDEDCPTRRVSQD
jgi:hypothetical protein